MQERIEIELSDLEPGMIIAKNIWDETGKKLLIGADRKVTPSMINRLAKHRISSVYIYIETDEKDLIDFIIKKASAKETKKGSTKTTKPAQKTGTSSKKSEEINIYNTFYNQISNLIDICAREMFRPDVDVEAVRYPIMAALNNKEIMKLLMELRVKAQYLITHSIEVTLLCSAVGLEVGMDDKSLKNLLIAALLHDIGMTQIKDDILFKIAPLDPYEIEILRSHSAKSVLILKDCTKIDIEVLEIIYQHHEKVNGSGYPQGLTDNIISNLAKILSVSDAYSAISHERCYRKKLHPQERIEFLFASGDHYFSYDIVKILLDKVSIYYKGQWIKLNTGHVGIISGIDPNYPTRPYIRLIYDEKGNPMSKEKEIFLADRLFATLFIEKII